MPWLTDVHGKAALFGGEGRESCWEEKGEVGSGETGGRKRKKAGCGGAGKKLINWLIKKIK